MGIAAPSGFGEGAQPPSAQVLVVDDSEIGLRLLQRHLLELGAAVTFARSGQQALALIAAEPFSHVLVDSMMSGMAGLKTCRAIKSLVLPQAQRPRVVLITNLGGSSDRSKGLLAGCDAYLLKPFKLEDLRAAMTGQTLAP
jgi:putative two-component system response regulator